MADELEKFVLKYEVDSAAAAKKIEELEKKIKKTDGAAKKTKDGLKEFASGAASEVDKLIPGIDAVTSGILKMGAAFSVAAAAVAIVAAGVKAVIDLRERMEQQRLTGNEIGLSGMHVEEIERKFVRASGGRVTREKTRDQLKTFSSMLVAAQTDPTTMGTEARKFRLMGVNFRDRGGKNTSVDTALAQLAKRLQSLPIEKAVGYGKAFGLDQDSVEALRKLGASVGKVTEMTKQEIAERVKAEDEMKRFNSTLAETKEKFTQIEMSLAQKLLPSLNLLLEWIQKVVNALPDHTPSSVTEAARMSGRGLDKVVETAPGGKFNPMLWGPRLLGAAAGKVMDLMGMPQHDPDSKEEQEKREYESNQLPDPEKSMREADKTAKDNANSSSQMKLAINMFAGAVASFANAVDENQAISAWAGEIGKASGIGQRSDGEKRTDIPTVEQATKGASDNGTVERVIIMPKDKENTRTPKDFVSARKGDSRAIIVERQVEQTVAGRLGVPIQQLMRGDVNKGDVSFATRQLKAGIENNIFNLNRELMIPGKPQTEYARIRREIRDQNTGLSNMQKYSSGVVENSREGGREITKGERPIISIGSLNLNNVQNPEQFIQEINNRFQGEFKETKNGFGDGISH